MSIDWAAAAPAVIILLVACMGYVAARRATAYYGWYNFINKSVISAPGWLFGLLWFLIYVLLAWAWINANYEITDQNTFEWVNYIFVAVMILILAWMFLFFGDGNMLAAFFMLILIMIGVLVLAYLLYNFPGTVIIMMIFFLWCLYLLYLNYFILVYNNIGPMCSYHCPYRDI